MTVYIAKENPNPEGFKLPFLPNDSKGSLEMVTWHSYIAWSPFTLAGTMYANSFEK